MMLYSTAWMNIFETGCHCPVEPCTRICPSSVVYHGSTGRLHCVFLICFCCLRWCKHDFYCGGFESVLLRFRGSDYFWSLGGGGRCEVHLNNGSSKTAVGWILMDGKLEKEAARESLGRLVD